MARRRRLGEDVTELEELMRHMESRARLISHVNFMDGSESHDGRTLADDQRGDVRACARP